MVFSSLMLIWVSYSVDNHHVVAVVLQDGDSPKSVWFQMPYTIMQTL